MKWTNMYSLADAAMNDRLIQVAATISGSPTTFGLNATIAAELSDASDLFSTALADWDLARVAAESANFIKEQKRDEALATFAKYINLMYATPTVSEASISTLGFDPRSTTRSEIIPTTPLDFMVTPYANGTAKLKWNKGENKYGVSYMIEIADADMSNWTLIKATTKTSYTVTGMTPGVPKWFRVKASKNNLESDYSFPEGIYIPASGSGEESVAA